MKKMKMITAIFFMVLGTNTFAMDNQTNDYVVVTGKGYGFQCRGFCSGNQEDSELIAKRYTDSDAISKCQNEGYEGVTLIGEYECNSYTQSFGNIETTTYCNGTYLCE